MSSFKKEQGFAHLLVLAFAGIGLLVIASLIPVGRTYNDGKSGVAGIYLAKGGDDSGSSGSSGGDGSSGSSGSGTTPQRIKSEIRQGNLRVKFEVKDGRVEVETKIKSDDDEVELEDEAEDEALDEIETELEEDDIRIATAPGQIALVHKRVGALSKFPLSVDPTTRELTVTTPAGSKVVAVLPQQAVDNMLASKVMTDIVGERVDNELASIPNLVKLEEKDGILVYKVKGTKTHKLLGFIPIKTGVTAFVSAENGQVVESTDSFLGRILNRIAP